MIFLHSSPKSRHFKWIGTKSFPCMENFIIFSKRLQIAAMTDVFAKALLLQFVTKNIFEPKRYRFIPLSYNLFEGCKHNKKIHFN